MDVQVNIGFNIIVCACDPGQWWVNDDLRLFKRFVCTELLVVVDVYRSVDGSDFRRSPIRHQRHEAVHRSQFNINWALVSAI